MMYAIRRTGIAHPLRLAAALLLGLAFGVLLLAPVFAFAQVDGGALAVPIVLPGADDDTLKLVQQLLALFSNATSATLLGTLFLAVKTLVDLTKTPAIDRFISQVPWGRPLASVLLGFLLVFLGALVSGSALLPALGAGLVAGFTAGLAGNGWHELWSAFTKPQKAVERDVGAILVDAIKAPVKAGDKLADDKLDQVISHLQSIKGIPFEDARLARLAELSNANPPKAGV